MKISAIIIAFLFLISWCVPVAGQTSSPLDPVVVVAHNGKYGYIDQAGKMVIPPIFIWGNHFDGGYADVYVCGKYVWIDRNGKILLERPLSGNELRPKRNGDKIGFVDASGSWKTDAIYEDALPFSEGFAAVERGGMWGFIDASGREVIPPRFKSAFYFYDGVGIAETESGYVLIDRSGEILAKGYDYLEGLPAEGRVPASRDGKSGYLDLHGNIAIPFAFDFAGTFHDGLAPVERGGKFGYIDTSGQIKIPLRFDKAEEFMGGLAVVKSGQGDGFVNESGEFAFHLDFDWAYGFDPRYGVAQFQTKEGKFGIVDKTGKVIWGPTKGAPDHAPLLGWSEKSQKASCDGIPEEMRKVVSSLPSD